MHDSVSMPKLKLRFLVGAAKLHKIHSLAVLIMLVCYRWLVAGPANQGSFRIQIGGHGTRNDNTHEHLRSALLVLSEDLFGSERADEIDGSQLSQATGNLQAL